MPCVCECDASEMRVRMYRCAMWKAHLCHFTDTVELMCPITFLSQFTELKSELKCAAKTEKNLRHCVCAVHEFAEKTCVPVKCLSTLPLISSNMSSNNSLQTNHKSSMCSHGTCTFVLPAVRQRFLPACAPKRVQMLFCLLSSPPTLYPSTSMCSSTDSRSFFGRSITSLSGPRLRMSMTPSRICH